MAFHYLWLREGYFVDHLAWQTVDLFSEKIGVHGLALCVAKVRILFIQISIILIWWQFFSLFLHAPSHEA